MARWSPEFEKSRSKFLEVATATQASPAAKARAPSPSGKVVAHSLCPSQAAKLTQTIRLGLSSCAGPAKSRDWLESEAIV